ncbi:platelet-derived growth factor receptor-like protein isoform 2-T2 [Anableps anableps]
MRLLKLSESKWRLVLSALLVCAVIFESDTKEQKTAPESTSMPKKSKLGKVASKRQRADVVKPKIKSTVKAQTKTLLTQVLGRGVFKKVRETLSVQTGDTLSLRCRGKPVQWSVPRYVEEDEGRLMIVQQEQFNLLTLVNTTVADTGEYTCYPMYCEDRDCRREYNKAVKVFIFFPDPMAPPAPVIQASSSVVAVGDNLRVTCAAVGEQDMFIEFNWEYPGQQIGRPLYTEETTIPVSGEESRQQFQSVLQVDEVRDVDQGTYTCIAQNLQGAKSVSTTVKVVTKAKAGKLLV